MKNFLKFLMMAGIITSFAMMAACTDSKTDNEDPTPTPEPEPEPTLTYSMKASLQSVEQSVANVLIEGENIASYAYVVQEKANAVAVLPDVVLATGTTGTCDASGKTVVKIEKLMPQKEYVAKFVGIQSNEEFYKDVLAVEFTTTEFTDEITFFNADYKSISVQVNLPEGAIKEGNVVKWGIFDVVTLNMEAQMYTDAERLNLHDNVYANYFTNKFSYTFNEDTNWFLPPAEFSDGEEFARWYPLSPGQPTYLMLGEFQYNPVESQWHAGWGPGYYDWCFDLYGYWDEFDSKGKANQADFWSGYYKRHFFTTKEPAEMDIVPDIKFNLTPKGTGSIDVTFKDGIAFCCVSVLDMDTYKNYLMPYLNNDKSLLPWYNTSYNAFMNLGTLSLNKSTPLIVEDLYWLDRDVEYVLMASSLSDENGSKRSYYQTPFKLPEPTKPTPVAEIKAVPNPETGKSSDSSVWFNLRAVNGDADYVRYIANYEREWMQMQNQYTKAGYTEQEALLMMLNQYGGYIPAQGSSDKTELNKINSAEGLTIEIKSRANASTICGFVVYNDEGTPSAVVTATARTDQEPAATPIESTLYEDLKGQWTMSATVKGQEYINNVLTPFERQHSSDVTIGDVSYEQTLPEEVYMIYSRAGMDKDEVDAIYAQFRTAVDEFNAHNRAQNRILCNGFDFETGTYGGVSYAAYRSPYELFIDPDYSGYNYESPIYDFGPKWYFQVQEGGTSVTVPFNIQYFAPAAQWLYYVYQLLPVGNNGFLPYAFTERGEIVTGHFPVEISADKNTITIKQFVDREGYTYYPNLCRYFEAQGQVQVPLTIISDVVMTRKTTSTAAAKSAVKGHKVECNKIYANKPIAQKKATNVSRTAFNYDKKIVKPETKTIRAINAETFQKNVKNYIKSLHGENARSAR